MFRHTWNQVGWLHTGESTLPCFHNIANSYLAGCLPAKTSHRAQAHPIWVDHEVNVCSMRGTYTARRCDSFKDINEPKTNLPLSQMQKFDKLLPSQLTILRHNEYLRGINATPVTRCTQRRLNISIIPRKSVERCSVAMTWWL